LNTHDAPQFAVNYAGKWRGHLALGCFFFSFFFLKRRKSKKKHAGGTPTGRKGKMPSPRQVEHQIATARPGFFPCEAAPAV
jgi:hypothetical protein